jgi:hypothetical protein
LAAVVVSFGGCNNSRGLELAGKHTMRVGISVGLIAVALMLSGCIKGDKGDAGIAGPPGAKGDVGQKGEKGDKGDKGDKGERGEKGDKGDIGVAGLPGTKGDTGDAGQKGDAGQRGDVGQRGEKGDKGERGDRGERGVGVSIRVQRLASPNCGGDAACTLQCTDEEELISASCIGGGMLDVRAKDATCSSNTTGLIIACVRR